MTTTRQTAVLEEDRLKHTNRQSATLVGILFILASVSAVLGLLVFYPPILTGADYLTNGAGAKNQVVLGALMELVLVCTAIGTAIVLFPVLRPYGERIALGHFAFRFLEAVVITVGVIAVLALLTVSQDFVAAAAPDSAAYHVAGTLLRAVYRWAFMLGPLFFLGINTLMYSSLLYRSRLVPRWLAGLGMAGAALVFVYAMLVLFGLTVQGSGPLMLLAMPIAAYEMILAVWLIAKGFNPSARASAPAQAAARTRLSAA